MHTKEAVLAKLSQLSNPDSLNNWDGTEHEDVCPGALQRAKEFFENSPDGLPMPYNIHVEHEGYIYTQFEMPNPGGPDFLPEITFTNQATANAGFGAIVCILFGDDTDSDIDDDPAKIYEWLLALAGRYKTMHTKEGLIAELESFAEKSSLNDFTREKHYEACSHALRQAKEFVEGLAISLALPQHAYMSLAGEGEVVFEWWVDEGETTIQLEFLNFDNANVQGFNYSVTAKNSKEQGEYTGSSLEELYQFLARFLG